MAVPSALWTEEYKSPGIVPSALFTRGVERMEAMYEATGDPIYLSETSGRIAKPLDKE